LYAALILDAERVGAGKILFRPTLHLAGHALELLLKACLCLNGQTKDAASKHGHNIWPLWESMECNVLRKQVIFRAKRLAKVDQRNENHPEVQTSAEIESIEAPIKKLCDLHKENLLRYREGSKQAPDNPRLVKTLYETSDDFFRQPSHFKRSATP
jgi:hypothetical protein